ncbi:GNAT family N-acetyltransferase [Streptomyces marianii]|uniref:GNAT family N-acetyltransferase n=1 Tax=Streptomyces marianii TaxID=1817406 RepID=A0A5R9EG55_9ACTN|nr:GNAT family N-acetyltransferase [Streptomyces marianii]
MSHFTVEKEIPADWDTVVTGPAAARSRWIRLTAERFQDEYKIFMLREEDGRCAVALGGTIVSSPSAGLDWFNPPLVLSGGVTRDGLAAGQPYAWTRRQAASAYPCLLLVYPHFASFPVGNRREDPASLRRFLTEVTAWAQVEGARSIALLFLHPVASHLMTELSSAGFAVVPLVERCDLDVTWKDFDGYLESLPKRRRGEVRRELRLLESRGITLSSRHPSGDESDLVALRCQLVEKYRGSCDPAHERSTFEQLRELVAADDITIFTATKDGRLLNFGLFVRDGDEWVAFLTGADYQSGQEGLGYFANLFYRPAALAPSLGIRTILYGPSARDAKRRRGCRVTPLFAAGKILS